MKKLLSIILSLVLLCFCVYPCAYADEFADELEADDNSMEDVLYEEPVSADTTDEIIDIFDLPTDIAGETEITEMPEVPAEEPEIIPEIKYKREALVLEALGIMETEDYSQSVTRAEFVASVAALCGYSDVTAEATAYFGDVSEEHEYAGAIAYAAGIKLVQGDGGNFRPDDTVTAEEAIIILLRALGYDSFPPYETVGIADGNQEDIYDGVSVNGKQPLTFDVATKLIYNAMNMEMILAKGTTSGGFGPTLELGKSEKTLLNYYKKIYVTKGRVTDNGLTTYSSVSAISGNRIRIDSTIYEKGNVDATNLLGHKVEAYYDENNVLLHISDVTAERSILYIPAEKLMSASLGNVQYKTESGKIRSVNFPTNVNIVYNGKALKAGEYKQELLNPEMGSLKLVCTTDNNYDLLVITSEFNCVVEKVQEQNGIYTFVDINDAGRNVKCDVEDLGTRLIITDNLGKPSDCSRIGELNVLSVAKSLDGEVISVKISSKYDNGIINAITFGKNSKILIGDTYYKLAYGVDTTGLKNGVFGWYYLDVYGNVAHFRSFEKYEERYGYLIKVWVMDGDVKTFKAKIFDESGHVITASAEKKFVADGSTIKGAGFNAFAENFYSGSEFVPCMVRYKLNLDGELESMDTYQTVESDTSLRKIEPPKSQDDPNTSAMIGKRRYYINSNRFDGDLFIDSNTKIFAIPVGVHDDEDYRMLELSHFVGNRYYDIETYTTVGDSYMAEAMIVRYAAKYDPNNTNEKGFIEIPSIYANYMNTGIVTDSMFCLDANGDVANLITVHRFDNAKSYSYYIRWDDMQGAFDIGDIIRYYWIDDQIIDAELAFDCNTRTFGTPRAYSSTVDTFVIRNNGREAADNVTTLEKTRIVQANWAISYLDALSINSGILTGALTDASDSVDEADIRRINLGKMNGGVLRYDSHYKLVSVASEDDIVCYNDTNSECSELAVLFMGGTARCIVILD